MRFYNAIRQFYCGVDLHARSIYICIMNKDRKVLVHRKLKNSSTDLLLKILQPYKHDLVVGAESTFAWYWLADFCAENDIEFILHIPANFYHPFRKTSTTYSGKPLPPNPENLYHLIQS